MIFLMPSYGTKTRSKNNFRAVAGEGGGIEEETEKTSLCCISSIMLGISKGVSEAEMLVLRWRAVELILLACE